MKKGSKKTIKTKPNPEYKLIEERVEADTSDREKYNKFFTARNIALIIVFFTASVALLVVIVLIVLHIDFKGLANAIAYGFTVENSYVWFLLLILYFVYSIFTNFGTIWVRLRKWGYHIPFWEYWLYGAVTSFLKAVTPVLFSDPYTFFWLRTRGVPASRATSLLFTNTLWWQFIQFAVTLPSFIIVLCRREALLSSNEGIFAFIFLCSGITIDVISIAFMIFLNMSKSMHSIISRVYNWIKKKFHMKYHTKEQIELKYKQRAALKEDFIKSTKDWKTTILIVLIFALNEIVLYFAINWSLYFVQNGHYGNIEYTAYFNFWDAFNCGNVTFTASRISSIVPGNNGPLEKLLNIFLVNLASFNVCIAVTHDPVPLPEDTYNIIQVVSNNGIIIWRIFGTYLPAVTGLGCLISLSIIQYRCHKAKQANSK